MIIDKQISGDMKATVGGISGDVVQGEYKIKSSAKAFSILSSSLYSNPIQAIIRELSCNARDSHIAAGNPEPFEINIPTVIDPVFRIKDRGLGLSHEEVMNLYMTYFESTKTESNDFVGALGLGSKSPFSYTSNFTVIAIKNGIRNVYSSYLNDQMVPATVRLDSSETNEPNGVEISFPVKKEDFSKFKNEANYALMFFEQKPIGHDGLSFKDSVTMIGNVPHVSLPFDANLHYYRPNLAPVVVMGGVPYIVDMNNDAFKDIPAEIRGGTTRGRAVFFADIGEVDFQPSREGLHYTQRTIAFVRKKFNELSAEIDKQFENLINKFDNDWDRSVFVQNYPTSKEGRYSYFDNACKKHPLYNKDVILERELHVATINYNKRLAYSVLPRIKCKASERTLFVIHDTKDSMRAIVGSLKKHDAAVFAFVTPKKGETVAACFDAVKKACLGRAPILASSINEKWVDPSIGSIYTYKLNRNSGKVSIVRVNKDTLSDGANYMLLNDDKKVIDSAGNDVHDQLCGVILSAEQLGVVNNLFFFRSNNKKIDRSKYKLFDYHKMIADLTAKIKSQPVESIVSRKLRNALYGVAFSSVPSGIKDPELLAALNCFFYRYNKNCDQVDQLHQASVVLGLDKELNDRCDVVYHKYKSILCGKYPIIGGMRTVTYQKETNDQLVEFCNYLYSKKA